MYGFLDPIIQPPQPPVDIYPRKNEGILPLFFFAVSSTVIEFTVNNIAQIAKKVNTAI